MTTEAIDFGQVRNFGLTENFGKTENLDQTADFGAGGGETDPYFASVQILLTGEGANLGTVFDDASNADRAFAATSLGAADAYTDTSQFQVGTSSIRTGATNFPRVQTLNNTGLHPGSGDFTLEFWMRLHTDNMGTVRTAIQYGIAGNSIVGIQVGVSATNRLEGTLSIEGDGEYSITFPTTVLSANTWYFVTVARSGTDVYGFLDGVLHVGGPDFIEGSVLAAADAFSVGGLMSYTAPLNGWTQQVRYTVGVARYTANFTPPIAAFPTE